MGRTKYLLVVRDDKGVDDGDGGLVWEGLRLGGSLHPDAIGETMKLVRLVLGSIWQCLNCLGSLTEEKREHFSYKLFKNRQILPMAIIL